MIVIATNKQIPSGFAFLFYYGEVNVERAVLLESCDSCIVAWRHLYNP